MRKRQIKKYGGSFVIHLLINDLEDLNLKEGDFVDIDDLVKLGVKDKEKNENN